MAMKDKQEKKKRGREVQRAFGRISQIGVTMAICVLLGVFLGRFLDARLGTSPWLLLAFSLLGAGAAIMEIYRMGKKE